MREPQRRERFGDRGGMMREVVIHANPVDAAAQFQPPLDAHEALQAAGDRPGIESGRHADHNRRERVAHVVQAEQRNLERADQRAGLPHLERRARSGHLDVGRLPMRTRPGDLAR